MSEQISKPPQEEIDGWVVSWINTEDIDVLIQDTYQRYRAGIDDLQTAVKSLSALRRPLAAEEAPSLRPQERGTPQ